jgi:HTH-type transcriptional regulator/antitoxin HigA
LEVTNRVVENGYFELVRRFPLRPIRSKKELDGATAVIDDLISRTLSPEEGDYLDVLSDLVEKYESEHYAIPDANPIQVLQFFIEDRQTSQRAVATGSGIAVSTMSQILSGQRPMNLDHMQKLASYFGVDVAVFLPKSKPVTRKTARDARKLTATPRRPAAKR